MSNRLPIALFASLMISASACGGRADPGNNEVDPAEQARTGELCSLQGAAASCGEHALLFCDAMSDPLDLQWGPCLPMEEILCQPGEVLEDCTEGQVQCKLYGGVPFEDDSSCWDPGAGGESGTPLVLRFDDRPVRYAPMSSVGFDIEGEGSCDAFDWPMPETPWLVLDRNGDSRIDSGSELFGSGTQLASGARASNGFEALAELDSNGDGYISELDDDFARLQLWADQDADRVGADLELSSLPEAGLVRIELAYKIDKLCDARGNCEVQRADFVFADGRGQKRVGEVVDVHLACQ